MRAIGWDHPRCMEPMLAATEAWHASTGVTIAWEFRPLASFNDQPVRELAADFDLLVIDHPHIPEAAGDGAILKLEDLLPADRVARLVHDAVGASGTSYRHDGGTYALAADAACQVSAHRPTMLAALDEPIPQTWDQVLRLARRAPGAVGLPLTPADALCSLLSIAATLGRPITLDTAVDPEAVAYLSELAPLLHPDSWSCAPPQMLVRMAGAALIAYVPLVFGYSGLAGAEVRFGAPPAAGGVSTSILGGAGVAVSASCADARLAAGFAAWLCEAETQRDVVLARGGQPAHRAVWERPAHLNTTIFYTDTRVAMERAFVRPAHPAWPAYHRHAGADLAAALRAGEEPARIASRLTERLRAATATSPGVTE